MTSLGLHASPTAGSFAHLCTLRSQYALLGQTTLSLQGPPMATGAVQTSVNALDAGAVEHARSFAQVAEELHSVPAPVGTMQLPHTPAAPSWSHRPLAHCHELLQEPPLPVIPPWGVQTATLPLPRNWSHVIAPSASPHCWAITGVQPVCGALAVSAQESW
jgi:hypothetical protein